jgi:hypothetical protein
VDEAEHGDRTTLQHEPTVPRAVCAILVVCYGRRSLSCVINRRISPEEGELSFRQMMSEFDAKMVERSACPTSKVSAWQIEGWPQRMVSAVRSTAAPRAAVK